MKKIDSTQSLLLFKMAADPFIKTLAKLLGLKEVAGFCAKVSDDLFFEKLLIKKDGVDVSNLISLADNFTLADVARYSQQLIGELYALTSKNFSKKQADEIINRSYVSLKKKGEKERIAVFLDNIPKTLLGKERRGGAGVSRKISSKKFTWIDVYDPTTDALNELSTQYKLDKADLENARSCNYYQCPKITLKPDYIFLVLIFPNYTGQAKEVTEDEIGIFLSYEYCITVHATKIKVFDDAFEELQDNPKLISRYYDNTAVYLFYDLLTRLYNQIFPMLDKINKKIKSVEEELHSGAFEANIHNILTIKSSILSFNRILLAHNNLITKLNLDATQFFGRKEFIENYSTDLLGQIQYIWTTLESYGESIESIENTNNSMVDHETSKSEFQINKVITTLTVLTVLTYPLFIFTALFSTVNSDTPLVGERGDFWIMFSMIAVSTAVVYVLLKKKRWL